MEQSAALVALSEKDLALQRAQKRLQELPEKLAILELRHKIKDVEGVAVKARKFVSQAEHAISRAEDEAATLQSKIDAEQAKISSGAVTNHKEIANLAREIDSLTRQKDKKETEVLTHMERLESGKAQSDKLTQTLQRAAAKEQQLIGEFQTHGRVIQAEIDTLNRERTTLARVLEPELLEQYESVRAAKHGVAVGVLNGYMCSACRIDLPADKVHALRAGGPIGMCPNCHRLMVIGDEESA
ncbi:MAG: zinc ribbon domain-containing protein [Coriobacteriia bacterium]